MCLTPWTATLDPDGGRPVWDSEGSLKLPCGKCPVCIKKRALEWSTRAKHELSLHKENCFITLTYDDDHLKSNYIDEVKTDFKNFIKNLREKLYRQNRTRKKIRYMVSYEYGTKKKRPHCHAILFGYSPSDQVKTRNAPSGFPLFESKFINDIWKKGYHSLGEANVKTAYYIAAYALKGSRHSITIDETGEVEDLVDTMDASKRPAIGFDFLRSNMYQLVDSGDILPRYYVKKLKELNPTLHERYENERLLNISNLGANQALAKFVIDQQWSSQSSEYRENTVDKKYLDHLHFFLQQQAGDYAKSKLGV